MRLHSGSSTTKPLRQGLLALCLLCSLTQPLLAEDSVFEYILDPAANLSVEEVIQSSEWTKQSGTPSFGYTRGAVWIRLPVPDDRNLDHLNIKNPWLNDLRVILVGNGEIVSDVQTGNDYSFQTRPVDTAQFAFPLPRTASTVYIRQAGENSSLLPYEFRSGADLGRATQLLSIRHGLYYGIIVIVLFYNLVLFAALGKLIFLYFVCYGGSLALTMLCSDGTGMQFLWPDNPWLQNQLSHLSVNLTLFSACLFAMKILNLKQALPKGKTILTVMMLVALVNGLLWLAFPLPARAAINASLTAIYIPAVLIIGLLRARQGYLPARFWVLAHGIFLLGAMVFVTYQAGWFPPSDFAQHSIQIGSTLELAILSVGLSGLMLAERRKRVSVQQRRSELANRVRKLHTENQLAEEYRQLQRSLQQAQKLKTIGQMSGGFAHDFNNILAGILGFAELAEARASKTYDPKLHGFIAEITQAGIRGRDLVKQLMIYSRGERYQGERLDLVIKIKETLPLLRGSLPSTIEISSELDSVAMPATIGGNQLQQVLVNLALNAAEATQQRGSIHISLAKRQCQKSRCASCLNSFSGEFAVLKMEDTGHGVQGNIADLFTPFYTTKEVGQGSGMGLSVVHGIVHEAGGHLKVSTRAQGGTRMSVFLPLSEPGEALLAMDNKKILLIEDDESVARYFEALLNHESYDVTVTNLSTVALEKFMANPEGYDLIITDQVMPHMTGLELARDMHALRPKLPIILCSAYPGALDGNDIAESGITAVFSKPFEVELLLAKIKGLLSVANTQAHQ